MEKNNASTGDSLKKVVVIGPECTGKSSLSALLADHYNTVWVPEYARIYIDQLDRPYQEQDLVEIAKGQLALEDQKAIEANALLICDTDAIVIKIWFEYKYGYCPEEIRSIIKTRKYDLYLLTYIDIPWEDDPQRENPNLRQFFYDLFKRELKQLNVNYIEVKGDLKQRQTIAVTAINKLL